MTYGGESFGNVDNNRAGADVSHTAELVRGDCIQSAKAPSSGPSGHLLPKGRRDARGR
jgi:hypothetical protein